MALLAPSYTLSKAGIVIMGPSRKFVPTIDSLESLILLATIPAEMASFDPSNNLIPDPSDSSGDTVYGFPGMKFTVRVSCPQNLNGVTYVGIKQVTYNVGSVLDAGVTSYSTTQGSWKLISQATHTRTPGDGFNDGYTFACPKDPGTVTINIDEQVLQKPSGPLIYDDLTDTLTIKVESPTVNSFQVSDNSGPGNNASPLAFVVGTNTGGTFNPDPTGTYMGWVMANGSPPLLPARDWVGFWANITNNTHYSLYFGFIQTVDFTYSRGYADLTVSKGTGTNDVDVSSDAPTFMYNGYGIEIPAGVTSSVPLNDTRPQDSPVCAAPLLNQNSSALISLYMSAQFQTNLVIWGGFSSPGGSDVPGFPVALSTASWHLYGSASHRLSGNDWL